MVSNATMPEALTAYYHNDLAFPEFCDATRVIVSKYLFPEGYVAALSHYRKNPFPNLQDKLLQATTPYSPMTTVGGYLNAFASDDSERAQKLLSQFAKFDLSLPQ
jgi:hypothetical protein